jgi:hypothetical protein
MKHARILSLALALLSLAYGPANAAPVVYSGWTVADGQLGSWTFNQALVTIQMKGDTGNTVTTTVGSSTVFVNDVGTATVTIRQGGYSVTARLDPNQIFARLDIVNGQVGFGSTASPYYPFSLGCFSNPAGCDSSSIGAAGGGFSTGQINEALVDVIGAPGDSSYYSAALSAEANDDLRGPMLMTGHAFMCLNFDSTNEVCPSVLPPALTTDKGNLYFSGFNDEKGVFRATVSKAGNKSDDD